MKKVVGFGLMFLVLIGSAAAAYSQSQPYTPEKGSADRKAILDAVRKFRKAPSEVYAPSGFSVLKGWAYVSAPDPADPDVDTEAFELVLRKTGSVWKVVDQISHVEGTDYMKERKRIKKRFPAMPMAIFPEVASDG